MKAKLLHEDRGQRTFALIFDAGDAVMHEMMAFAEKEKLGGSHFTAIGAFENVTLGYFDWQKKDYQKIPIEEQVEVVSFIGDVALNQSGKPKLHAHVVVGRSDGTALGGHLLEAKVRPTLEVVLVDSPEHLVRKHDPTTGLALIEL